LSELGKNQVYRVEEREISAYPADGGTSILADVVRRLDASGIQLAELGLTQPTLDDVFLAITGHAAENVAAGRCEKNEVSEKKFHGKNVCSDLRYHGDDQAQCHQVYPVAAIAGI